jgi:AcrR family transcriptional regulator
MAVRKPKRATGIQLGEEAARGMVIAGAARVFAQKGIRAASVEDLLAAANVSRRTFYRLFESKDDVALALYKYGTKNLIASWKHAIESTSDPLEQSARCIDAHLRNAATVGRLIFVLGGEASRQESPLHKWRMEVHDTLIAMMSAANPQTARIDPMLRRTTLFAMEAITRYVLELGDEGRKVDPELVARARKVMLRVVTAAYAGTGPGVEPLPLLDS